MTDIPPQEQRSNLEGSAGIILAQIGRVGDATITEIVRLHGTYRPRADELTLARISRAREDAARQLAKTRDHRAGEPDR